MEFTEQLGISIATSISMNTFGSRKNAKKLDTWIADELIKQKK